jgi:hypothetical protein
MLVEHDGTDVWLIDHHVDDGEVRVREILGDSFQRSGEGKTRHDHRIVAGLGKAAQRLFALGVGLKLEFAVFDAGFLRS